MRHGVFLSSRCSCACCTAWDSEDPWAVVGQFRDAVAPGSYLALSHMTDEAHPEAAEGLFRMTQDLHRNTPLISRNRADITRFFDGFALVEPTRSASAAETRFTPIPVSSPKRVSTSPTRTGTVTRCLTYRNGTAETTPRTLW
jgi:hypothetical protein